MALRNIPPGRFIVVADSGMARILRVSGAVPSNGGGNIHRTAALDEVARLDRPSAHQPARALTTDRPGRVFDGRFRSGVGPAGAARQGSQGEEDPHAVEIERFAKSVARRIDAERRNRPMREVVLIAAPRFLGHLRPHLSAPTRGLVRREIARDLTHSEDGSILRTAFAGAD